MSVDRPLPTRRNHLVQHEHTPPVEVLADGRELGSTELKAKPGQVGTSNATKPVNLGNFDYLHLKVPLPKDLTGSGIFPTGTAPTPTTYYLMRRSSDGYVSVTGMFKATFPWATKIEEELERAYFTSAQATDQEEVAGNLWSTPEFALELASEYGINDWIRALLDPEPVRHAKPSIASPPTFEVTRSKPTANGTMSTRRTASRDLRSASPVKNAAPTPNRPKATPRKRRNKKAAATPSIADSAASDAEYADEAYGIRDDDQEAVDDAIAEEVAEEIAEEIVEDVADTTAAIVVAEEAEENDETLKDDRVRVSVVSDVVPGEEDTETTRTTVKVELPSGAKELELPKDTEGVVEMAREIIEGAKDLQEGNTDTPTAAAGKKSMKRKADVLDEDDELQGPEEIVQEVAEGDATELASGEVALTGRPAKRTRVMVPAEEYRREKVRRRALVGLSGALAVGVMIPFLQNLF